MMKTNPRAVRRKAKKKKKKKKKTEKIQSTRVEQKKWKDA